VGKAGGMVKDIFTEAAAGPPARAGRCQEIFHVDKEHDSWPGCWADTARSSRPQGGAVPMVDNKALQPQEKSHKMMDSNR